MTALVLEYIKLVMLFLLIGCIIGLSHFSGEKLNGSNSVAGRRMRASARARRILVLSIRLEVGSPSHPICAGICFQPAAAVAKTAVPVRRCHAVRSKTR